MVMGIRSFQIAIMIIPIPLGLPLKPPKAARHRHPWADRALASTATSAAATVGFAAAQTSGRPRNLVLPSHFPMTLHTMSEACDRSSSDGSSGQAIERVARVRHGQIYREVQASFAYCIAYLGGDVVQQ